MDDGERGIHVRIGKRTGKGVGGGELRGFPLLAEAQRADGGVKVTVSERPWKAA